MAARTALVILLVVGYACVSSLCAATFTAVNTNDAGAGSLRQAMLNAVSQIGVHDIDATAISGRIALASPLPPVPQNVNVAIEGPGPSNLTISRTPFVPPLYLSVWWTNTVESFFRVEAGGTLTCKGLRVSHESYMHWRFLYVVAGGTCNIEDCIIERTSLATVRGDLDVRDCIFRYNTGHAILLADSAATLFCKRTLFAYNSSNPNTPGSGSMAASAAIHVGFGAAVVEECQFICNYDSGRGAIYTQDRLTVRDCVFRDNSNAGKLDAAAITAKTQGEFVFVCERTLFESNRGNDGGAIHLFSCSAYFRDCTFVNNSVASPNGRGGAFYAVDSKFEVHNCTFSGNQAGLASGKGGALYFDSGSSSLAGPRELISCTITGNTAVSGGGGIFHAGLPSVSLKNTVVSGNSSTMGAPDVSTSANGVISLGHNFIGNLGSSSFAVTPTDITGTTAAPRDALLGPLQYNGGPTPTHVPQWGSPVLDVGTSTAGINSDQRGLVRMIDLAGVANGTGGGTDIGATERQSPGTIGISVPALQFLATAAGTLSPVTVLTCSADGVSSPMTVSCSGPFDVSLSAGGLYGTMVATAPPDASGIISTTQLFIRYAPQADDAHTDSLAIAASGAETITVKLSGRVLSARPATIFATADLLDQWASGVEPYMVSGQNLTEPITITSSPPFYIGLGLPSAPTATTVVTPPPVDGVVPPTAVWVVYSATTGSRHAATLTHRSPGAPTVTTAIYGDGLAVVPSPISLSTSDLKFSTSALHSPSPEQSYAVSGSGLSAPVTISVLPPFEVSLTAGSGFSQSVITPAPSSGTLPSTIVFVRYRPTEGRHHAATLFHDSTGVSDATLTLQGTVLNFGGAPGVVSLTTGSLSFSKTGWTTPSAEQIYSLSGSDLPGGITIAVSDPFEISFTSGIGFSSTLVTPEPVSGVLPSTDIYVRYNPAHGTMHSGAIAHYVEGAQAQLVAVTGSTVPPGPVVASTAAMAFTVIAGQEPSAEQSYLVSGDNLLAPISIAVSPPFEVSFSSASGFGLSVVTPAPSAGIVPPTTIYVRYNPTSGASHAGTADHSSLGSPTVSVNLTGTVLATPFILVSTTTLAFVTTSPSMPSPEQSYTVAGGDLLGPVLISASLDFEVSLTSGGGFGASVTIPAPAGGSLPATTIYARFNTTTGAGSAGTIDHASLGASTTSVAVAGAVVLTPTIFVSTTSLQFNFVEHGLPPESSYVVQGVDLTAPIDVTAPPPFEVSLSSGGGFGPVVQTMTPTAGVVPATVIFVRYGPSSGTSHSGAALNESTGAPTVTVILHGSIESSTVEKRGGPTGPGCSAGGESRWVFIAAIIVLACRVLSRARHTTSVVR